MRTIDQLTYWNGEPAIAERCTVTVGKAPPGWWCAELEGTTRKAVRVYYGDQVFYLDDESGSAWAKVTRGKGSPTWESWSLPDTSVVIDDPD